MITNQWKNGQEDLTEVFAIRREAMGKEYEKADEYDGYAMHVIMYVEENPAATGRLYHDGQQFKMDGLCVLPKFRHQHVGDLMARLLLFKSMEFAPRLTIDVLEKYVDFYRKFGFREIGRADGHIQMQVEKEAIIFPSECGGHNKG